ncbi:MAG: hypothetical protein EON95_02255, partial [Caulobacteraceae bacterium]
MKRILRQVSIIQILGGILVTGAIAFIIWGPGAPDVPIISSSSTPAVLMLSFGTLAVLLIGLSVLFRAVPSLA